MGDNDKTSSDCSKWIKTAFESWREEEKDIRKTITEFAAFIGITQEALLDYITGRNSPHGMNLAKIAVMIGYDVYDLVGKPRPDPLLGLPTPDRIRFAAAFSEFDEELQEKGYEKESREARILLQEKLLKFQFYQPGENLAD